MTRVSALIHIYDAPQVKPLVLDFYEHAWTSLEATRRVFEQIGLGLTRAAFRRVPFLQTFDTVDAIYAGPIARAGCGLFRPSVVDVLTAQCQVRDIGFHSFGMGLHRVANPLRSPARVYWNTLRRVASKDLTSSTIIVYDMGEATGSTIEGVITALKGLHAVPRHVVFLLGAVCLDQTRQRLDAKAPGISLVIGSRWRYNPTPGPTQFYLTHIEDAGWRPIPPRDWGRCISGMVDHASVRAFISWVGETVSLTSQDHRRLLYEWSLKIDEPGVMRDANELRRDRQDGR